MFMMSNTQRFMLVIVMIAWGSPDCLNSITEFIGKLPLHCMFVPRIKHYMYGRLCLWKFLPVYFVRFLFTTQRCAVDKFLNQMTNSLVRPISFAHTNFYNYTSTRNLCTFGIIIQKQWSVAFNMLPSIIQLNQTVNTGDELSPPITNNEVWWPFEPVDFSENLIIFI